jgi:NifZ domain.
MIGPREPIYYEGQRVVADVDLVNDGSYPERAPDALLVEKGTVGEVVQVGMHAQSSTPVYMVDFAGGCVVGCLEEELARP